MLLKGPWLSGVGGDRVVVVSDALSKASLFGRTLRHRCSMRRSRGSVTDLSAEPLFFSVTDGGDMMIF